MDGELTLKKETLPVISPASATASAFLRKMASRIHGGPLPNTASPMTIPEQDLRNKT